MTVHTAVVPSLADAVLPLIRTRSDLHRWSAANAHGAQMHDAVDILEAAMDTADPASLWTVTTKAIASATTVIMRADDSSGIMGHAIRRLLALHPRVAQLARPPGQLPHRRAAARPDAASRRRLRP